MNAEKRHGLHARLTDYGDREFSAYLRRSFARSMGYSGEMLDRPIVGIANTASGFNNCHRHFPELLQAVKRGVLAAGCLPLEFPTISLGEIFLHPTSLKYRNLMSMDTEEMIRAQPMDSVVLMGGCDKTLPAQMMGAISANIPAVTLVAGPMMTARQQGVRLGACTDCRRFWASFRAGEIDRDGIDRIESSLATTAGTCPVMGTASTMACMAEVMGFAPPGSATIPAVHADRLRVAEESGRLAAKLALDPICPQDFLTNASIDNALRTLLALGGSTNALIHLAAIAGRLGLELDLHHFNDLSASTPVLLNLKPTGHHYMEDFHDAGGLPALLSEIRHLLQLDAMSVTGKTLGEIINDRAGWTDRSVIASCENPIEPEGGLVALFGSLAPNGAIIKRSAADPALFEQTGRAVVFNSLEDLAARIDDPGLDVAPGDFLILKNAGPASTAGMPEAGYLPIPRKLLETGVRDMVRISDARMSGTAFGTIVLHVSPEAAVGGPLSLTRTGDRISLSVSKRRLDLLVDEKELLMRKRQEGFCPAQPRRGYGKLHADSIMQADRGCDFTFLTGR